ncbi:integrin alpha-6 [Plakobranchus ocellatus]|uniref:Integrin alpha-6 n=1 Tax=Plakobranchus ocellatus TaxID=259542 RepID=A0AAV4B3R4_9GAST|nr:integrin alpha-6 [Plakobranchus ocellatus]
MLVGAPKEKRVVKAVTAGGSLYKCDAGTSDSMCELVTDTDPGRYKTSEFVEDQWLGVTVSSAGANKKAVVNIPLIIL